MFSTTKRAKWFQAGHSSTELGLQSEVSRLTAIRQLFMRRSQGEDDTCFDVIEDRDLWLRSQVLKALVVSPLEMWSMVHRGRFLFNVPPSQVRRDSNGEHPAWAYDFKSLS
jgi:hypothetical protein